MNMIPRQTKPLYSTYKTINRREIANFGDSCRCTIGKFKSLIGICSQLLTFLRLYLMRMTINRREIANFRDSCRCKFGKLYPVVGFQCPSLELLELFKCFHTSFVITPVLQDLEQKLNK